VVFGTISNISTGTAGYENFTALSTNAVPGTAYTITITPAWTSTVFSEGYAVWIDYNKNGLFTDAGELVFSKAASTVTPASGSFTIPVGTALGSTRMRVSMKYNAIPTSCETLAYGQVEDYTVNISSVAKGTELETSNAPISIYPNPTNEILFIENSSNSIIKKITLTDITGKLVLEEAILFSKINMQSFQNGIYILSVTSENKIYKYKIVKQ
jgi:hypothetical protein